MASKSWVGLGFALAGGVSAIAFFCGVPMFGYKYIGLDNGGAVAEASVDEAAIRASAQTAERKRLEAYIDDHRIVYNRYGCAYYVYRNGEVKAAVFTKDGPVCDGTLRP